MAAAAAAAATVAQGLQEELFCPICLDYFTEPVILGCEHNFCKACITTYWAGLDGSFPCPQCRKRTRQGKFRLNTQLGKVAAKAREIASVVASDQPRKAPPGPASKPAAGSPTRDMCQKHQEGLKLFCKEDQALICVVCDRSQEHREHMVVPVEEAAQECKAQLLHHLAVMKNERDSREILGLNNRKRLERLVDRAEAERQRMVSIFQQLQNSLQDRQREWLEGLSKVTNDLKKMQRENDGRVQYGAPLLQLLIAELEQKCREPDLELLKNIGILLNRCKLWNFPTWVPASTTELEERISHYARKKAVLWEGMADMREILILDPESAHPGLTISADRRTVSRKDDRPAHHNHSRRFYPSYCVLGSEGFASGRHHWLVDVKGRYGWALGVAQESVDRKQPITLQPERGVWAVELGPYHLLPAAVAPETETGAPICRILVSLDYEAGHLAFSDCGNQESLFTFRTSFKDKLYPFFWLWGPEASITLCP